MKDKTAQFNAYWLGTLSPTQQHELEEAYFADSDLYNDLLDAKDGMMRRYLAKTLTADERQRFEQFFLTQPGRRAELALMRCALNHQPQSVVVARPSALERLWELFKLPLEWKLVPTAALGAFLLICLGSLSWYLSQSSQTTKLTSSQSNQATPVIASVATLRLQALYRTGTEADGSKQLLKDGRWQTLNLQLEVEQTDYPEYCVSLTASSQPDKIIAQKCELKLQTLPTGDYVNLSVAAQMLAAADYEATLFGVKADHSQERLRQYSFTIR